MQLLITGNGGSAHALWRALPANPGRCHDIYSPAALRPTDPSGLPGLVHAWFALLVTHQPACRTCMLSALRPGGMHRFKVD